MPRYIGYVYGKAGPAHRLGSARSGLQVNACGWNIGARVTLGPDPSASDFDTVAIELHGGSSDGRLSGLLLGTFTEADLDKLDKLPSGVLSATIRTLIDSIA